MHRLAKQVLIERIKQRLAQEQQLLVLEREHWERVRTARLDETMARLAVESREHQVAGLRRIGERQAGRRPDSA